MKSPQLSIGAASSAPGNLVLVVKAFLHCLPYAQPLIWKEYPSYDPETVAAEFYLEGQTLDINNVTLTALLESVNPADKDHRDNLLTSALLEYSGLYGNDSAPATCFSPAFFQRSVNKLLGRRLKVSNDLIACHNHEPPAGTLGNYFAARDNRWPTKQVVRILYAVADTLIHCAKERKRFLHFVNTLFRIPDETFCNPQLTVAAAKKARSKSVPEYNRFVVQKLNQKMKAFAAKVAHYKKYKSPSTLLSCHNKLVEIAEIFDEDLIFYEKIKEMPSFMENYHFLKVNDALAVAMRMASFEYRFEVILFNYFYQVCASDDRKFKHAINDVNKEQLVLPDSPLINRLTRVNRSSNAEEVRNVMDKIRVAVAACTQKRQQRFIRNGALYFKKRSFVKAIDMDLIVDRYLSNTDLRPATHKLWDEFINEFLGFKIHTDHGLSSMISGTYFSEHTFPDLLNHIFKCNPADFEKVDESLAAIMGASSNSSIDSAFRATVLRVMKHSPVNLSVTSLRELSTADGETQARPTASPTQSTRSLAAAIPRASPEEVNSNILEAIQKMNKVTGTGSKGNAVAVSKNMFAAIDKIHSLKRVIENSPATVPVFYDTDSVISDDEFGDDPVADEASAPKLRAVKTTAASPPPSTRGSWTTDEQKRDLGFEKAAPAQPRIRRQPPVRAVPSSSPSQTTRPRESMV